MSALSTLILLFLSKSQNEDQLAKKVSCAPEFISSVGRYISHTDKFIRRCGLLVAEVVAKKSGRQLSFGGWEGEDISQLWAKSTEILIGASLHVFATPDTNPVDYNSQFDSSKVMSTPEDVTGDSDDSMTGYASDASSTNSFPSPTEVSAMEKDTSLRSGLKKKVVKPVFISQLLDYLRITSASSSDSQEVYEKVEIAMSSCEDLIRRKRNYGSELGQSLLAIIVHNRNPNLQSRTRLSLHGH
jgi:telomere length regulation protein